MRATERARHSPSIAGGVTPSARAMVAVRCQVDGSIVDCLAALRLGACLGLARIEDLVVAGHQAGRLHVRDERAQLGAVEVLATERSRIQEQRQEPVRHPIDAHPAAAGAGQSAGQHLAEHRQAVALVPAERQQRARRVGAVRVRVGGRLPGAVDQVSGSQRLVALDGDLHLAGRDRRGGDVHHHRRAVRQRRTGGQRIGRQTALAAAVRSGNQPAAVRVGEREADQPLGGGLLHELSHAPEVRRAPDREHAVPAARLLDRPVRGYPADVLAEAEVAVYLHHVRLFDHTLRLRRGADPAAVDPVAVRSDADEAMRVVAALVGEHQRLGHDRGDMHRRALGAQKIGEIHAQRGDRD